MLRLLVDERYVDDRVWIDFKFEDFKLLAY